MEAEAKSLHGKTSTTPIYLLHPNFKFHQTSAHAYIMQCPFLNSNDFPQQPDWLAGANDLGPWAEVLTAICK